MTKTRKSKTGSDVKIVQVSAPYTAMFEDVEQVLEHVTSPFRWEILDVPLDEQKKSDATG